MFVGGRPWIAAWLLLAAGHVAGLLFPRAVLAWTRTPWHVIALEAAGFAIGLAALAACVRGAWLHMRRPSRGGWSLAADFADSVFMSFLFIAVASGLLAASVHRWGSQWAAVTMAPYAASLLHGRPVPAFVEHLPFVVRLHLFASLRRARVRAGHAPGRPAACARAPGARRRRARAERRRAARARVGPAQAGGVAVAGPRGALGRRGARRRAGPPARGQGSAAMARRRARSRRRGEADAEQGGVMRARWIVFGFVLLGAGGGLLARGATRIGVHQGYAPEQPIAFPHKVHAGDNKIPCLYCHSAARTSRHAGIPSESVCMNCHALLEKQTTEIQRLKEAFQQRRPIVWTKVHNLPDFVYFNHSQHVVSGVACQRCHGAVEQMDRIEQAAPLTMGWCLGCHRAEAHVPTSTFARVAANVRNRPTPFAGEDCTSCHY